MKVFKNSKIQFFVAAVFAFLAIGCSDDNDNGMGGTANLRVSLVDAPGDYDAVNIEVIDVLINYGDDEAEGEEDSEDSGWQSIGEINSGVYDLLKLTGGVSAVLADNEVPTGELGQIRLLLGENNTVVMDGETFPLKTPSSQQSGLKINVNETLEAGFTYDIILDLDVDKSIIVEAGSSGNILLNPVIHASSVATSGKIQGSVTPFDFQVLASIEGEGVAIASYADENGVFVLNGVPAGTYDVTLTPEASSGYAEAVVEGVVVENGVVTELEPVELEMLTGVGNVTGSITNEGVAAQAKIVIGEEEYTAETDENGVFTIYNIPEGTYTLEIAAQDESGLSATKENVTVTEGQLTEVGEITLE
ncbi:DUF4382 domain-containing protein [Robertkochia aurantiaca]|uniref:DUF4382 domain-containing protein n=1 Tax=Robertkochia aurantiaca TaxID=2873700 RepID=UPI001CCAADFB|nr:DUF4382 domain-containing protein [Robertkochia sp. 3YJGBD-33]